MTADRHDALSDSPTPSKKKGVSLWGCLGVAMIVLLLALGAVVARFEIWRRGTQQQAMKKLVQMEDAGLPTSGVELDRYYDEVSDELDVTPFYLVALAAVNDSQLQAAMSKLKVRPFGTSPLPPVGQDDDNVADAVAFVEEFQDIYAQIVDAGHRRGRVRIPVQFAKGYAVLLEEVQQSRSVSRLLSLKAKVHLRRGETEEFVSTVEAMIGWSEALREEPIMVSMLVRCALASMACNEMLEAFPSEVLTEQQLIRLSDALSGCEAKSQLRHSIIGECAMGVDCFMNPEQAEVIGQNTSMMMMLPTRHFDLAYYLETMELMLHAVRQPWPEAIMATEKIAAGIDAQIATSGWQRFKHLMSSQLTPAFDAAVVAAARVEVLFRATSVALALERFRQRTGAYPDGLDQLVPEYLTTLPTDPFDGQTLRYRAEGEGFVVYSVSKDRVDDGGDFSAAMGRGPDMGITVPVVPE